MIAFKSDGDRFFEMRENKENKCYDDQNKNSRSTRYGLLYVSANLNLNLIYS